MKRLIVLLMVVGLSSPFAYAQSSDSSPGIVPECQDLSLYCIQLLPTRAFAGARGYVEMARPASPFGLTEIGRAHV